MNVQSRPYIDVYQVLDEVCFAGSSPAGARGRMFTAIDRLRQGAAPAAHLAVAERISIALHKLDWAILNRDPAEEAAAREALQVLGASWHQMPIPVSLN